MTARVDARQVPGPEPFQRAANRRGNSIGCGIPVIPATDLARPLPQDLDAERKVLGAILIDGAVPNKTLNTVLEEIGSSDGFFQDAYRLIFSGMVALHAKDLPIEETLLVEQLHATGELKALIEQITVDSFKGMPRINQHRIWARIVKGKSVLRNLMAAGQVIQQTALDPGGSPTEIIRRAKECLASIEGSVRVESLFHSFEEVEQAPPLCMAIKNVIQLDAATAIGALAGHGKTWLQLSIADALLRGPGTKLWGYFDVLESVEKVVYLIPESTLGPFSHRLRKLNLLPFVKDSRLLIRTLSKGPRPSLSDPKLLEAARGSYVMLDTLVRFGDGSNEDSAGEFQVLADAILALMGAGAIGVSAAHHAPKSFANATTMTLEACLRGTGDIGAVFATVFGAKQIDSARNIVHVEAVKCRDFEPPEPFELIGRPYLDELGDFEMHKAPGACGRLQDEQQDTGGAPAEARQQRQERITIVKTWLEQDPNLGRKEVVEKFKHQGIRVSYDTAKVYLRDAKGAGHEGRISDSYLGRV